MSALQNFPKPHVIEASAGHTHTVILLHGRGSSGHEFASDLLECQVKSGCVGTTLLGRFPHCKWVFPSTRQRYSSTSQEVMSEWFDTVSLADPSRREDLQIEGLAESVTALTALINQESTYVMLSNILLGGISQGYATATHVLMAPNARLAGFIGLSGWMPFIDQLREAGPKKPNHKLASVATDFVRARLQLEDEKAVNNQGSWEATSVFLGHELHDEVVACDLGEKAKDAFLAFGVNVSWHTYDSGEHWLKEPEEVEDLVSFIDRCLA